MRIYINKHYFVSVLKQDNKLSCQLMELIHGNGMQFANVDDEIQDDIVSSVVHESDIFTNTNALVFDMVEVFKFHKERLMELLDYQYHLMLGR